MERVQFLDASNAPVIDTDLKLQTETDEEYLNMQVNLEDQVLNVLLQIEKEFRSYYEAHLKEAKIQADIIDKLWSISSRYLIASGADSECKYFEKHSVLPEETIIFEYQWVHGDLLKSIETLEQKLAEIRPIVLRFRMLYKKLNKNLNTPFVIGSTHHKPIAYFIELVEDIFCYFYCGMCMMHYQAKNFDPTEPETIIEYKRLLEYNEDFEDYLMNGLAYCKCLLPKPECLTKAGTLGPQTCMERYTLSKTKKRCMPLLGKTISWQMYHPTPEMFSVASDMAFRSLPPKRRVTRMGSFSSSTNCDQLK